MRNKRFKILAFILLLLLTSCFKKKESTVVGNPSGGGDKPTAATNQFGIGTFGNAKFE
ncbi:MAG: hypothetical protein HYT76_02035 [Deltaproteobacteria bacterium]|nr:hypothetical protein [Deltaproteobacteria bacterium]